MKILPLLTSGAKEDEPSFHVVAPSLPNYGFSQRTSKPGFAPPQYAEVCHKLMLQLGYQQYGACTPSPSLATPSHSIPLYR